MSEHSELSPCEARHTHKYKHTLLRVLSPPKRENSCVWISSPTHTHAGQPVGGTEVKAGVTFHHCPKNGLVSMRPLPHSCQNVHGGSDPHALTLMPVIHRAQGLNLYRPSVKHKSKYVNEQSERDDHKHASKRVIERSGGGSVSKNGMGYYEKRRGLY